VRAAPELVRQIAEAAAALLEIDPQAIDPDEPFIRYGLDSVAAVALTRQLGEVLGRAVSPVAIWRHPTPRALAEHLAAGPAAEPVAVAAPAPDAVRPLGDEPIAIVGMACRFPGAPSTDAFWRLLCDGVDAIRPVPLERWDAAAWSEGGARWGGFLDNVDRFDPMFFAISPREAVTMDPQQRLILELTWEALEHAGIVPGTLTGSPTGVYIGSAWVDYARLVYRHGGPAITQHTVTGHHRSILANRVSYAFGLAGPSLAVDSACSSGLLAVHLACDGLVRGDATVALAGAVNLNLLPESTHSMARFGALSPDGRCFTFDARANGYVRGEGGAVVVLKRLSRAIADGDPIVCVIRGSAVNNDGASNGLTAPNPAAQEAVLRAAYRRAEIGPDDVQYVELHGTGTQLGDPIEASALGAVLGRPRSAPPLVVGSAKTNVGHLEAAAGMVGLVKTALCIHHRRLVPSLHFATPNPHIPFDELKLRVSREAGPWPRPDRLLVAGVSSFGMGGTNAHVVVAEWPSPPAAILALAADDAVALADAARRWRCALPAVPAWRPAVTGRHRLAVTGRSPRELARGLDDFLAGTASPRVATGQPGAPPRPVFVFAGQGLHWLGMGRSLLAREPVFRAQLLACGALLERQLGWSLIDELTAAPGRARLDDVEVGWPASLAIQVALLALWRSWGVEPAAVIGHSGGEIAAAYAGGALDLDDAIATTAGYARMLARVRGQGAMGVVGLPWEAAGDALAGYDGRLFRAIEHGADTTVVAGEPAALDELFRALAQRGTFCRRLAVDVAPHSPLVGHLRGELGDALAAIRPRPSAIPIASAALGKVVAGERFDAAHWVQNFCEPLAFSSAIDQLIDAGHHSFLELSPHPGTLHAIQSNLRRRGLRGALLPSLRHDADERGVLLDALAALHALGANVRWDEVGGAVLPAPCTTPPDRPVPVPLSGRTDAALAAQAAALAAHLDAHPELRVTDVAHSLATTRTQLAQRAVIVAGDRAELRAGLEAIARGTSAVPLVVQGTARGTGKLAFVFPGQGSQWPDMARALLATSGVFAAQLAACADAVAPHVDWSPHAVLRGEPGAASLDRVEVVQPVLFAVMVALAALWRDLGVVPDAVIGHSQGEIAAACVAGALSLDDAARVVARRSRAIAALHGRGTMALVELPADELGRRLARAAPGGGGGLAIAAINGPRSTVVSGPTGAIDALLGALAQDQVFARKIRVDYASHGPEVEAIHDELLDALAGIRPRPSQVPMISTVTGQPVDGSALDADYWYRNLRHTVRFLDAVTGAVTSGHAFFVEVSPHPVLTLAIEDAIGHAAGSTRDAAPGAVVGSLRRDAGDLRQLLGAVGELHTRGAAIDWRRLVPDGRRVALPTYAFQRERYWLEPPRGPRRRGESRGLFGAPVASSLDDGARLWDATITAERVPYLADHVVDDRMILPGVAYAAMVIDAMHPRGRRPAIEAMELHAALDASPPAVRAVQLAMIARGGHSAFRISSRDDAELTGDAGGDDPAPGWVVHATGELREAGEPPAPVDLAALRARCPQQVTGAAHYAGLRAWRLAYGPGFAGVTSVWRGRDEAIAAIAVPELRAEDTVHRLDPRWLDAALQVALALDPRYPAERAGAAVMPVGWRSLRVHDLPRALDPRRGADRRAAGEPLWSHARLAAPHSTTGHARGRPQPTIATVDVVIMDATGHVWIEVEGLRLQRLEPSGDRNRVLRLTWCAAERPPATGDGAGGYWIVVARGASPRLGSPGDRAALGDRLRACLEARGERAVAIDADDLVAAGPAAHAWLRDQLPDDRACRGAVHLAASDAALTDDVESAIFAGEPVLASALHLVQALTRQGWRDATRLWLITRGVQAAGAAASTAAAGLAGAPLLGFARSLVYEHPELRCTRLDLDGQPSTADADQIADELLAEPGDDELAVRDGHRFAARLATGRLGPDTLADPLAARPIRGDASYLVTGGFGGLGLSLARWLVDHGARHLVLAGRSTPGEAAAAEVRALEAGGATIAQALADVAVRAEVARLVRAADQLAPLRGVFHLAGVLDDGLVTQQDVARFRRVMAPKIDGAWHLHQLTRDRALDHFVLYSSVASLLGSPGQTGYAAANSFLDALALHRRARGLPALSIGWGPFAEVGLAAAREIRGERLADRGMASLSTEAGEAVLAALVVRDEPWVGVVSLDVARWLDFYPTLTTSALFGTLIAEAGPSASGPAGDAHHAVVDKLRGLPPPLRLSQLEAVVRHQLARVLQCPPDAIAAHAPFTTLGLESLTGLELRNRIEAETGLRLPATLIWTRGNLAALARDLLDRLFPSTPPAPTESPGDAEIHAHAHALTDDELLAELAGALDEADAS